MRSDGASTRRAQAASHEPFAMEAAQGRAILAAGYTDFLLEVAARRGVDRAALFGDRPVFVSDGHRVHWTHDDLGIVLQNLRRATNDELCGLAPGIRVPPGTFKFACELVARSQTLGEGLDQAFKLYDLMGGLKFRLDARSDLASLSVETPPLPETDAVFLVEWWLWLWHYTAQWLVRAEIELDRVEFPHDPTISAEIYDGTFGSRCFFGADEARIVFPRGDLNRQVSRTPRELSEFLSGSDANLKYSPEVRRSATTIVKVSILNRLHAGRPMPKLEELAEERGITGQTLRRWLISEGASYRRLKAEVRCQVARHNLAWSDMTVDELAARSGFAEASAFARAFRDWTGMSVSAFRECQRGHRGGGDEGGDLMGPFRKKRMDSRSNRSLRALKEA
jgi:AraC-like DNA-binding protein